MSLNKFQKKEKLCGKIRIGELFSEGKAFIVYPLRIVYRVSMEKTDSNVKIIISVPKKKIKLAVHRNYVKRMIREAYRLNKTDLINSLQLNGVSIHIAITYVADKMLDFNLIHEKVTTSVDRLIKVFNESQH